MGKELQTQKGQAHLDQLCAQFFLSQGGNVDLCFSLGLGLDAAAAASSQSKLLACKQSGNAFNTFLSSLVCAALQDTHWAAIHSSLSSSY